MSSVVKTGGEALDKLIEDTPEALITILEIIDLNIRMGTECTVDAEVPQKTEWISKSAGGSPTLSLQELFQNGIMAHTKAVVLAKFPYS